MYFLKLTQSTLLLATLYGLKLLEYSDIILICFWISLTLYLIPILDLSRERRLLVNLINIPLNIGFDIKNPGNITVDFNGFVNLKHVNVV